jgi:hypothetical protein
MRTQALAAFAAGALALGTCVTTGAPPRGQGFPCGNGTLPSGMQVVIEQDATASVAVLDDYARDLAAITVDEVGAAFNACRARSVITVVAPAPP